MSEEIMTTYQPDNILKKKYFHIFFEILNELKTNRWLIYQLFKRDFFAAYKQSFVGILWIMIMPLIGIGTVIILDASGVFRIGNVGCPYSVYAAIGMAFWQLFSVGLTAGADSLLRAGTMITKINFSKKSLVISSYAPSIVSFFIQLCIVGLLFIFYKMAPTVNILLLPLLALPLILFTLGLSFIFSFLNVMIRDTGNILSISVHFLLLLTPVLYLRPASGLLSQLSDYNILYYLIAIPRELILSGKIQEPLGFLISCIISFAVFLFGLAVFHIAEPRIAERI